MIKEKTASCFLRPISAHYNRLSQTHHYPQYYNGAGSSEAGHIVVEHANQELADHIYLSTQKRTDYNVIMTTEAFNNNKERAEEVFLPLP